MDIIVLFTGQAKDKIKNIICQECKDNTFIQFKDYKINCYGCQKGHKINNLLFKEFEKTQNIDLSKIKCGYCFYSNKANTIDKEFFKCLTCNNNLCLRCKNNHEKDHLIIFHDKINYFCDKHNSPYIKYCNECEKNLCEKCEEKHINHNLIDFNEIIKKKII